MAFSDSIFGLALTHTITSDRGFAGRMDVVEKMIPPVDMEACQSPPMAFSQVVKRRPQRVHSRRRTTLALYAFRVYTTVSSLWPHLGQHKPNRPGFVRTHSLRFIRSPLSRFRCMCRSPVIPFLCYFDGGLQRTIHPKRVSRLLPGTTHRHTLRSRHVLRSVHRP